MSIHNTRAARTSDSPVQQKFYTIMSFIYMNRYSDIKYKTDLNKLLLLIAFVSVAIVADRRGANF